MEKKPKKKYKIVKTKIPEFDLSPKIEKLQKQLNKDPKSKIFLELAEEYRKSKMEEEAVFIIEQSIIHHPHYYAAKIVLAKCYLDLGKKIKAKQAVDEILEKSRNNVMALRLAADLAFNEGDYRESREFYERITKINPTDEKANQRLKEMDGMQGGGRIELAEMSPDEEMQIERTVAQEEGDGQAPVAQQGSEYSQPDAQQPVSMPYGEVPTLQDTPQPPVDLGVGFAAQQPQTPEGVVPEVEMGVYDQQDIQQQAPYTEEYTAADQAYMQPEFDTYTQPESVAPIEDVYETSQEPVAGFEQPVDGFAQQPIEPVSQQETIPLMDGMPQPAAHDTNAGFDPQPVPSVQIPSVEFQTAPVTAPETGYNLDMAADVPTVSQEVTYQKPDVIPDGQYTQDNVPVQPDTIPQIVPETAPLEQDSLYSGPATQSVDAGMGVAMIGEPLHGDIEGTFEKLQSQADQILPDKIEPSAKSSEIEFPNISQPDNEIVAPVHPEAEIPLQQPDFQVKQQESADGMVSPPSLADQGGSPVPILESNKIPKPGEIATQKMKKVSLTGLTPPTEGINTENMGSGKLTESGMVTPQPSKTVEPHDISIHNMTLPADIAASAPLLSNSQSTENYDIELAEFYTKQGRLGKAIEIYRKLLQSNPSNHELAIKLQEAENLFSASGGSVQAPNDNL